MQSSSGTRDIDAAWQHIGARGLIYEKFQRFSREVSIIGARSVAGEIVYYPLSANTHAGGILRYGVAPFAAGLERTARIYLKRVMSALGYVGVLADRVLRRERQIGRQRDGAARPQLRPLDDRGVRHQPVRESPACDLRPAARQHPALGHTAMINFLGQMPSRERLLAIEGLAFHDYGKEPRPGRKLGHCTILQSAAGDRDRALADALQLH